MEQQNVGARRGAEASVESSGSIGARSHEAAEQIKGAVVEGASKVRDQAQSAREQTAARIRDVAQQLRNVSQSLESDDPLAASAAERVGRGIESVATYVGSASVQGLVRDTEGLARRQPALFFGGAFLLGLAAGRFLKSSRPEGNLATEDERYGFDEAPRPRRERESGLFPASEWKPDPNAAEPNSLGSVQSYTGGFERGRAEPGRSTPERSTSTFGSTSTPGSASTPGSVSTPGSAIGKSTGAPSVTPPPRKRDNGGSIGGAGSK